MLPGSMLRMFIGVGIVPGGHMRVMSRFLMVAGFVMLSGFAVMMSRLRVMMSGLLVMMRCFLGHCALHSGLAALVLLCPQVRLESSATADISWVTPDSIEGEYALNSGPLR